MYSANISTFTLGDVLHFATMLSRGRNPYLLHLEALGREFLLHGNDLHVGEAALPRVPHLDL